MIKKQIEKILKKYPEINFIKSVQLDYWEIIDADFNHDIAEGKECYKIIKGEFYFNWQKYTQRTLKEIARHEYLTLLIALLFNTKEEIGKKEHKIIKFLLDNKLIKKTHKFLIRKKKGAK